MKPVLILLASTLSVFGQAGFDGFINNRDHDRPPQPLDHDAARALRIAQKEFVPQDPWRTIHDGVHYAKGDDWFQFYGTVIGQSEGKTYIHGWCGLPLDFTERHGHVFCVSNFPAAAVGEVLEPAQNFVAWNTGFNTTYYSAAEGAQPCLLLDYGQVWTPPPPTPDQIAAAHAALAAVKAQADAAKKKADDAALKYDQDLAAKGDAFGQLRMGERYRDGDNVVKDLAKARAMFTLAAAQGDVNAAGDLAKLPPR